MNKKLVSQELKAEVIHFYFENLNNSFDWVADKFKGRLTYYMCDKIVQEFLKNKSDFFIIKESKLNNY
jgi:hypothetical protein